MSQIDTAATYLRRWMQQVMANRDWNAEEWARQAQTSPTNITRFLKGSDHIPSYSTLVKLALAAGVPIPTPGMQSLPVPKLRLPLLNLDQVPPESVRLPDILKLARLTIVADQHGPRAFAVCLENSDFAAIGYQAGDIVVVDPDTDANEGAHVLATNGRTSGICIVRPQGAVVCGLNGKHIPAANVKIIGPVIRLIRKMT